MKNNLWILLTALLLLAKPCCADQPVTLNSGKSIDIVSLTPAQPSQGLPIITITYRTTLPLSDLAALRQEVGEVWDHFAADADRLGYGTVTISALNSGQNHDFVLQKQNGNWRMIDFVPGETPKLTDDLVKEILSQSDFANDRKEINAALLYLGDNWTATFNYSKNGVPTAGTINRLQIDQTLANDTANFKHWRDNYHVVIADDGQTAKVDSTESESGIRKGKSFSTTSHSIDDIAIVGSSIVLTKSVTDLNVLIKSDAASQLSERTTGLIRVFSRAIIYIPFMLFMYWWSGRRIRNSEALKASGVQTDGMLTTRRRYLAIGGIGIRFRYKFQSSKGAQTGRMSLLARRVPNRQNYTKGMTVSIVYLKENPSVNAIKSLLDVRLTSARAHRKRVTIVMPILVLGLICWGLMDYFG